MASGLYRVFVRNARGAAMSRPATITVIPLQFNLADQPTSLTSTGFQATVVGASGLGKVFVYASTDLWSWEPIFTNPPTTSPIEFRDPGAVGYPLRFYRVVEE